MTTSQKTIDKAAQTAQKAAQAQAAKAAKAQAKKAAQVQATADAAAETAQAVQAVATRSREETRLAREAGAPALQTLYKADYTRLSTLKCEFRSYTIAALIVSGMARLENALQVVSTKGGDTATFKALTGSAHGYHQKQGNFDKDAGGILSGAGAVRFTASMHGQDPMGRNARPEWVQAMIAGIQSGKPAQFGALTVAFDEAIN